MRKGVEVGSSSHDFESHLEGIRAEKKGEIGAIYDIAASLVGMTALRAQARLAMVEELPDQDEVLGCIAVFGTGADG